MLRGGNDVAYCLWNDGIRLISLNGWNVKHLNNSDYSLLFNLVAEKEGVKL